MTKKNQIALRTDKTDIVKTSWEALSIETRKAYRSDLDQFLKFCNKPFDKVDAGDVSLYIAHLRKIELKNSTINRKIASISKMFTVYMQAGKIKLNPVSLVRTMQKTNYKTQRNVVSSLEFNDLKKALNKPVGERDIRTVLIVKFLGRTGCRITETLKAKRSDISQHTSINDKIMVFGKGNKERYVYLNKKLKKVIYKYFNCPGCDLLFPSVNCKQMNRTYFYKLMVEFFNRKTGMHVNPHKMRHFFATYKIYVEKMDVNAVSKFLGHSSNAITQDMYVDTVLNEKDADIDL